MSDKFNRRITPHHDLSVGDIVRIVYEGTISSLEDEIATVNDCHYSVIDSDMVSLEIIGRVFQVGDKVRVIRDISILTGYITALDDTHAIIRTSDDTKLCFRISALETE